MSISNGFDCLLDYTDWQRREWFQWIRQQDRAVLEIGVGPGGDGRFAMVGDLIRHIFSAEKRYIDRLSGRPITDTASIPTDKVEALFQLAEQSRRELREFVATLAAESWNAPVEFQLMDNLLTASPKKVVTHVLIHDVRHWAQIATLRLSALIGRLGEEGA